jgi:hypothetical protein
MKSRKTQTESLVRMMRRLLEALAEADASATTGALDADRLIVAASRKGVTVVRASLPVAAGAAAVAEGLAQWSAAEDRPRLRITTAGRAYLRRRARTDAGDATPDPFRAQHDDFALRAIEPGARATLVNETESPLAWLARRKGADGAPFLASAQIEAGERFRRDVEQAQLLQRVTANWEAPIAGRGRAAAGGSVSESAMDARRRLARAHAALGADLGGLLTDVCGFLKGLEAVERERGWPARSGKVVLRIALDRLADFYGIASVARGPARARGVAHWGAADYRPKL